MTAPTNTTTTTPPPLTATQARALLHTLLSTTGNPKGSARPSTKPINVKPARQSHPSKQIRQLQHNITFDASTRVMGHCNNIHIPSNSLSSMDQASRIEQLVRDAVDAGTGQGKEKVVNITIQAGVNVMGSKNVVVFGSPTGRGVEGGRSNRQVIGRKRRASSEPVEIDEPNGKKVKVEGQCEGGRCIDEWCI